MKHKTRSCMKKRFFRTKGGKGKLVRMASGCRHRLITKTTTAKKLAGKSLELKSANVRAIATYI